MINALFKGKVPYLYLLPAFVIFTAFLVVPVIQSMYFSFFQYDGMNPMKYIGIANYIKLFTDSGFYGSLLNTFVFTILNVVIQSVIAIPLAVILNGDIRCQNFFKSIFFLPSVLSVVVIGFVFQFIFNPAFGVFNEIFKKVGLEALALNWLGDMKLAMYTVVFVTCWQGIGYATVIYLGGLQSIPNEIYEAAHIDGSGGVRTFFRITFPMLAPVFSVAIVISTISNIKEFGRIYVMTQGGPAGATEVIVTFLYKNFKNGYMGYSSAVSAVLFAILLILSVAQSKILSRREDF